MLANTGREQKKFRFPVDLHLKQAVGALTLHTGVGTIYEANGHKKCQRLKLANIVACFKWRSLQRWGFFLNLQTFAESFFEMDFSLCVARIRLRPAHNSMPNWANTCWIFSADT